ncbi:MAG: DUF4412 domain-containing protein [Chitinophagaceae bacterium]|nr:DUF4412 domain-containing protein [Chitinophagaceae bacterium]
MHKILFPALLILSLSFSATAQRGYVRRAVEKNQEEKHEGERQKGEKAVDERLDTWDEKDKQQRAGIKPFPTMSMTLVMEYPEKPKNNASISYYYKNYDCASVMTFESRKSEMDRTIMNFKEGKSIMLMTDKKGKKTGMQMELKTMDWAVKGAVEKENRMLEEGDATLVATDEYQTIEGYKCRKYNYENEKYRSEIWVSTDVKIDYNQFNNAMYSAFASSRSATNNAYHKAGMKGVVIRMHVFPKDRHIDESIMTFKNFKLGSVPDEMFSTAGYEVTQMPSIRDMWNGYKDER